MTATVFDSMVQVLFTRAPFAESATYQPVNGNAYPVRVIEAHVKQAEWSAYQSHASVASYAYEIRASDIARPQDGDVLIVGGEQFMVRSYEMDETHLVWRLNLDKA